MEENLTIFCQRISYDTAFFGPFPRGKNWRCVGQYPTKTDSEPSGGKKRNSKTAQRGPHWP